MMKSLYKPTLLKIICIITKIQQYYANRKKISTTYTAACIFNRQLKVVKLDKAAMDYYMHLTTFHSQCRAIGVNYNQIVKLLKTTFSEKLAL